MKRLLLVLALIAVAFSGCMEKQPSTGELKTLMIDSTKNLNTYRFTVNSVQQIDMINRSANVGNETKMTVISTGEGSINLTGRALSLIQRLNLISDNKNATPMESETYFLNDTVYMKLGNNWTQLMLPNSEALWSRQNMVRNQAELLNNSEIELVGAEKVDGQDSYKVKVKPYMDTYAAILSEQLGSLLPLAQMNMTELLGGSSTEWTSWITKDTHLLKKNEVKMKLIVTPKTLGLPINETGEFEMRINITGTTLYKDFNQPIAIKLPAEASSARLLPILPLQAVPSA